MFVAPEEKRKGAESLRDNIVCLDQENQRVIDRESVGPEELRAGVTMRERERER